MDFAWKESGLKYRTAENIPWPPYWAKSWLRACVFFFMETCLLNIQQEHTSKHTAWQLQSLVRSLSFKVTPIIPPAFFSTDLIHTSTHIHTHKHTHTPWHIVCAAHLAKPGRCLSTAKTVPAPGRAEGYLPGRGELLGTSPALQTGRRPPPALSRATRVLARQRPLPPAGQATRRLVTPAGRTAEGAAGPVPGWPGWVMGGDRTRWTHEHLTQTYSSTYTIKNVGVRSI